MTINKIKKLRIEPTVREFMKGSDKTLSSRKKKEVSCVLSAKASKGKKWSNVHFENRKYIGKLYLKPFEKVGADVTLQ